MEKLKYMFTGSEGGDEMTMRINEMSAKINELIEDRAKQLEDAAILVEKIAKLEGENDNLRKGLDRLEKVVMKVIGQVTAHHHLPDGKPAVSLELLQ